MYKFKSLLFLFILITGSCLNAAGLLMPVNKNYPKDFLRLRSMDVSVKITGTIAETIVYQEFQNEWTDSTDAVYSFPLPADARATKIYYWYNNQKYKALLKVQEQAQNPGTGEGGVAALVNKYIGKNGIKIFLKGIRAGEIQKVELHYFSLCDYYKGKIDYTFPLNTEDFIGYPLDNLRFTFNVSSSSTITGYDIPGYAGYTTTNSTSNTINVVLNKPKFYINRDLSFYYKTDIQKLGVDFYSTKSDTSEGHFALFVRPQNQAPADSVLKKTVVFLISKSSAMRGVYLDASVSAVQKCLTLLSADDKFNIVAYDYNVQKLADAPLPATPENIQKAQQYLTTISTGSGDDLRNTLLEAIAQMKDAASNNSILIFSASGSNLDPRLIQSKNSNKTGIFPVIMGTVENSARLDMTADLNYGFVTHINDKDTLSSKILRIINQVRQPILKNLALEFGKSDISQMVPSSIHSVYAGSNLFIGGKYKSSGRSPFSIAGYSVNGVTAYDFSLDFSDKENSANSFAETIWAKEMIDALERQIEVYGETSALKQQLIDLSLKYNIRCRYTAYVADYKEIETGIETDKTIFLPNSFIAGNYPNPFNPSTRIRVYLDNLSVSRLKYLKVYDILGKLICIIDISNFSEGWHEVIFDGRDMYGNTLPSGVYFVRLEIDGKSSGTYKINLIK